MSATGLGPARSSAALMDRIYRRQRFIYDATRKYYLFGRDRLIADLAAGSGSVLEIGCGTGRNLVAVARRYPDAALAGLDLSTAMLDTAQAAFARQGLAARIRTAHADATAFDAEACFARASFDRVFLSYTLSMIPDWQAALRQAVTNLAPGGRLLIVDFGQLDGYPAWARGALFAWLRAFHVVPIAGLREALTTLAVENDLSFAWQPLFRHYAVYAALERRVARPNAS